MLLAFVTDYRLFKSIKINVSEKGESALRERNLIWKGARTMIII